ncbi:hypothetical protein HT594_00091 [Phenacoccus solenopsis nudivirus]|nr:hypothetical protein HT594_00091 [Phenacoccus solenopsis nudivirus]
MHEQATNKPRTNHEQRINNVTIRYIYVFTASSSKPFRECS